MLTCSSRKRKYSSLSIPPRANCGRSGSSSSVTAGAWALRDEGVIPLKTTIEHINRVNSNIKFRRVILVMVIPPETERTKGTRQQLEGDRVNCDVCYHA